MTDFTFNFVNLNHSFQKPGNSALNSSALKFKMASVGCQPEDDDDLHTCPARTRPSWPKKIIPWWFATYTEEKPPYSYSTLIAHAILTSKDGRLTLGDIYIWISENYPTYALENRGWQNSIRHNLSLNKKWFYKIDRRPTRTNPGKGCYWTIVEGCEQIFIDNLTHEGGHSRKHHDIGLTAELSVRQRRGACFYTNDEAVNIKSFNTRPSNQETMLKPHQYCTAPINTTFKMVDMAKKTRRESQKREDDSDNDSGVDVGSKSDKAKHPRKRRRAQKTKETPISAPALSPSLQESQQILVNNGTPSIDSAIIPLTNWSDESPSIMDTADYATQDWPILTNDRLWTDSLITPFNNDICKQQPITVNLNHEETIDTFLHIQQDSLHFNTMPLHYNLNTMTIHNDDTLTKIYPPSTYTTYSPSNDFQFQQFIAMQDIHYS